jgi:hypothetical protein
LQSTEAGFSRSADAFAPRLSLQTTSGEELAGSPSTCKVTFISASASRAFQRAIAANTLLPCDKLAASSATGYHATCPTPRNPVNDGLIWSQSEYFAAASGVPIRVNLVAFSGTTPSDPTSSSTLSFGLISLGSVITASESSPVWSMSDV